MSQTNPTREPYRIQAVELPERYARGWHVLGRAMDYTEEPVRLDYFGAKLVAYRGEDDGEVHVLDAYCPHMGADLSLGMVQGNSLVCPFHQWSWGSDGACDHIPYAKRIPAKAQIKSWPTMEENGLVFVWNDPEGNPPIEEQRPARMDDYHSGEWSEWTMAKFNIKTNCRELVDNMCDMAHFGPVHYSTVEKFSNLQEGHKFTQFMSGGHEILTEAGQGFDSVATYEGPAYMTTTMTGMMNGEHVTTHLLVSHLPISTEEFDIRFGVMLKNDPRVSAAKNRKNVEQYTKMSIASFEQDVAIWDNKVRVDNPLMCDGDGPINLVRKWYSQFYMDVADIPEALTKRKEHVTLPKKDKA